MCVYSMAESRNHATTHLLEQLKLERLVAISICEGGVEYYDSCGLDLLRNSDF